MVTITEELVTEDIILLGGPVEAMTLVEVLRERLVKLKVQVAGLADERQLAGRRRPLEQGLELRRTSRRWIILLHFHVLGKLAYIQSSLGV